MSTDTRRRAPRGGAARVRRSGITATDIALAGLLSTLPLAVQIAEHVAPSAGASATARSWWPLLLLLPATGPVAWWRSHQPTVPLICLGAVALHLLLVGPAVRCGWGIPLAFVLALLAGRSAQLRDSCVGLAVGLALLTLVLVRDVAAGPSLIPLAGAVTALMWGIGHLLGRRARAAAQLRERTRELAELRDRRADVEVGADRMRLSRELEVLLQARLDALARLADTARDGDPVRARIALERIESDGRATLADMRAVVSRLRGTDAPLAPTPTIAHLDALLAAHRCPDDRLVVHGDPRLLSPALELTAYRIVENLLTVLGTDPDVRVEVALTFASDAIDVAVSGPARRSADLRAAIAAARERTIIHRGTLDVALSRGRATVVAHLPAPAAG